MKINQIDNKAKIISKTLESIIEIEKHGRLEFDGPEGKKIVAEFKGATANGAKLLYVEIPNNKTIRIVVTYAPDSGEEFDHIISHKNEQNRCDKDLIAAPKIRDNYYFPCPFAAGNESPLTHHWSEYAGERIDHFQGLTTDTDKITAKFASALTAKRETIQKVLNGKEYEDNTRKIDAIKFENADTKRILNNYLDNATYKLEKALCRYNLIEDIYNAKAGEQISKKNNDELSSLKKDIDATKLKIENIKNLKNTVNESTFSYAPEEFAVIHPDVNLDNILVDQDKDYEISFIDGTLREKQTLQDYYGPKQCYYFLFKKTREWLSSTGDATRATYNSLSQMFDNLLKILHEDYAINEDGRDKILKDVIDAYFDSFHVKKNADKRFEKIFGKPYKTIRLVQRKLEGEYIQSDQNGSGTQ